MFRNPYSDHFDLFAGLKSEQTLEKEAGVDILHDVKGKVDSVAGEAKTAITENVPPWQKPHPKHAEDCVRHSRHCECSLGEAWDSMFKKQPGVVQDAEQKVIEAGHKIEEEAQEAGRLISQKSAILESTVENEIQEAGDVASKAAKDSARAAKKVASGAGQAAQSVVDQAADAIVKNAAK